MSPPVEVTALLTYLSRQERFKVIMARRSVNDCSHSQVVPLSALGGTSPMSNMEHTMRDIQSLLQSGSQAFR